VVAACGSLGSGERSFVERVAKALTEWEKRTCDNVPKASHPGISQVRRQDTEIEFITIWLCDPFADVEESLLCAKHFAHEIVRL
jgi:hypothetical protein